MATCRSCGYNFPPSDLSPGGLCECCDEEGRCFCGELVDRHGYCPVCDFEDDEEDEDDELLYDD